MRFYKAVQNFRKKNFYVNLLINIDYYVYTTIHKIKQPVLLSYVFTVFFLLKIPHKCVGHVTLTLTMIFGEPIDIRVIDLHAHFFLNIHQQKLWEISTFASN